VKRASLVTPFGGMARGQAEAAASNNDLEQQTAVTIKLFGLAESGFQMQTGHENDLLDEEILDAQHSSNFDSSRFIAQRSTGCYPARSKRIG
jgi:hypothetical protein